MKRSLSDIPIKIGIICIFTCLFAVLCVSCQSRGSAEEIQQLKDKTVTLIDKIKNVDQPTMAAIYEVTKQETDLFDLSNQTNRDLLKHVFKNFSYEIKNISIQDNNAYIDVIVNNTDMQDLYNDIIIKSYSSQFVTNKNGNVDMSKIDDAFIKALKKAKKQNFINSVQLQYQYANGDWQWEIDNDFLNAATGGYYTITVSRASAQSGVQE